MADIQNFNALPFDNHMMYLKTVALPNYEKFCAAEGCGHLVKREEVSRNEYLRRFLTAAESLNNCLDYYYWEHKDESLHVSDKSFRKCALDFFDPLNKLAEIANAYKHVKRTKPSNIKEAKELVEEPKLSSVISTGIYSIVPRTLVADLQAGGEFWRKYVDDPKNHALTHATLQNCMLKTPK